MSSQNIKDKIIDSALEMAALRDWRNVTLADISMGAGVSLDVMADMFECREDILDAYARRVDKVVLAAFPNGVEGEDARARLFDCLMERFDRLNDDRAAVVSILQTFVIDPKQALSGFPSLGRSMTWTLEACDIETSGFKGLARVAGLMGVFMWVMRAWRDDSAPDMPKTMAALDRALERVDWVSQRLGL